MWIYFSGNSDQYFSIDPATGNLFAIKEINRENLDSNEFVLELEAQQKDNPLKAATSKVCHYDKITKLKGCPYRISAHFPGCFYTM